MAFDVNRIEKVTKKCLNSIPTTIERERSPDSRFVNLEVEVEKLRSQMKGLGKLHRVNQSSLEFILSQQHKIFTKSQQKENISNVTTNLVIPIKKQDKIGNDTVDAKPGRRYDSRGRRRL